MITTKLNQIHIEAELSGAGCVFAEDEARLLIAEATNEAELKAMVKRRVSGERLEYVVGWAEFHGTRIGLEPGVFVPRRRTEFLVEQAIKLTAPGATVIDICCGSGALGLVLAISVKDIELYAADIDSRAVTCARINLAGKGRVYEGNLFEPLPKKLMGKTDIILANVPYVPTGDIELLSRDTRMNEPPVTFDGGEDGLDMVRRIAREAPQWLSTGGQVFIETSDQQGSEAARIFSAHGLTPRIATSSELNATVVIGALPR